MEDENNYDCEYAAENTSGRDTNVNPLSVTHIEWNACSQSIQNMIVSLCQKMLKKRMKLQAM